MSDMQAYMKMAVQIGCGRTEPRAIEFLVDDLFASNPVEKTVLFS